MTLPASRSRLHYTIAIVWLVFMVSMASWWLSLGLTMTDRHRMFLWEGGTFLLLLVAGGLVIVLAIRREHRRRMALETFFMSFTHDLKTAIASIQLQAEGIREDWPEGAAGAPLDRLLHDTVRLQIQLENSLYVAQPDGRLLRERIDVVTAIERLRHDWPELAVRTIGTATVHADARALDTVFRNVLQNAVVHGGATAVEARIEQPSASVVRIAIHDNGRGVPGGRVAELGEPFSRVSDTSGTGVGLFVSRQIIARLHGAMRFSTGQPDPTGPGATHGGLTVSIELPSAR
ncbi:MAG: HAMP domain-containing sensor histidine kinase [Acidobacteriota bacterium]